MKCILYSQVARIPHTKQCNLGYHHLCTPVSSTISSTPSYIKLFHVITPWL